MPDAELPKRSRRRHILALGAVIVGAGFTTTAANAASIAAQMEAVRKLEAEIAGYDARYNQAAASYAGAQAKVTELNARIATNTKALAKAKTDYSDAQSTLGSRLSMIYRQPEPTQVELLLRSNSFSEAISNVNYLDRVQKQDGRVVVKIRTLKQRIETARVALIADRKEQAQHAAEAKTLAVQLNTVRVARRGVLVSAQRTLNVMIAAEAARRANAARLAALRNAQRRVTRQIGGKTVSVPVSTTGGGGSTTPTASAASPDLAAKLAAIAQCESGGNPTAVSPSGAYRGKFQFDPGTWASLGGSGTDPAAASEAEQDRVAAKLYAQQGASPWPVCGR